VQSQRDIGHRNVIGQVRPAADISRRSNMRPFTTVLAGSVLLLVGLTPAFASCGSRATQVGALLGDPEKDTFGFDCTVGDVERTGSISATASRRILQVGATTGDAEKDTLGYLWNAGVE